jgi:segregation and condensation protein A
VLERVGGRLAHEIEIDRMSVTERIQQLVERLATVERVSFADLFADAPDVPLTVVTFLALLEMARLKMLRLCQAEPGGTIWITSTGVAASATDAEAAYAYRPIEPAPVPPPPPPSEEERAVLAAIEEGDEDEEDEDPPPEY